MAKQQSFADKAKKVKHQTGYNVKVVRAVKSTKGSVKYNVQLVKLGSVDEVANLK
jgi:hypothetical protein